MTQPIVPAPDSLIFDLDGTLWDTCSACALGWNRVVERHGIQFRTILADDVRKVVGRTHDLCIRDTFLGLNESELQVLIEQTAIEDNRIIAELGAELYPGVYAELVALSPRYPLFIVSNCQTGYIDQFLDHSRLREHFVDFECWGNTGQPKAENLRRLIERNQLARPWFIGDTPGDFEAARANDVPFVHAAYGFARCDEAEQRMTEFADLRRVLERDG